jgi:predicted TIM-barrel fold metal-dependent hydrolase
MPDDYPRNPTAEAFDSMIRGIPLPLHRKPQPKGNFHLPPGTRVISADNHWTIGSDIFHERLPAHLKPLAPRIVMKDGAPVWEAHGRPIFPPGFLKAAAAFDLLPGSWQLGPRLHDMDGEGVEKEIAFTNVIGAYFGEPNLELRDWIFRIHNAHMAEVHAGSNGRFHGVALLNYWDVARVPQALAELKAMGFKTFLIPIMPKGEGGRPLNYSLPDMEPLWTAIEDSGLPVCFHVGEFYHDGPGALATSGMINFAPFRKTLGELIFGGIFDRHPALQVVFAEAEINWIPGALQTAATMYDCYRGLISPQIAHHPRHYWHKHCYATFINDPAGLRLLDIVGHDRVMWSVDYPHQESAFGISRTVMDSIVDAVTPDQARAILGGTAVKVFKLDE